MIYIIMNIDTKKVVAAATTLEAAASKAEELNKGLESPLYSWLEVPKV